MPPENPPSKFGNRTVLIIFLIAFTVSLITYIDTCVDIYTAFKSGNSNTTIDSTQDKNKISGTFAIISMAALLLICNKQLVNIFRKHKLICLFIVFALSILIPVLLSIFKITGETLPLIAILLSVIFGIPGLAQLMQSFNKEKKEESGLQKNVSKSSPEFIQENSPTTIQGNSPTSIQENNNSPISIQNNINTAQNVTNIIDERSERERITTNACKMLDSKDLASRISAVKTLANMADSWLEDSPNCKKDEKKCQDIIDILCAHIRSSFPLAKKIDEYEARKELETLKKQDSKNLSANKSSRLKVLRERFKDSTEYKEPRDITTDYAKFHEEQDVRRAIFKEMSRRSSTFAKDNNGKIIDTTSGAWSGFDFDFSRAPIFYPLNSLTIEKAIFSSARFYGDADFRGAEFTRDADFRDAKFTRDADFRGAEFTGNANFGNAHFECTEFTGNAHFAGVEFTGNAHFECTEFTGNAHFAGAEFTGNADFVFAKFTSNTDFMGVEFTGNANFRNSTFTGNANFWGAYFTEKAYFTDAKFTSNTDFNRVYFEKYAPTFADIVGSTLFSAQVNPQDYYFAVRQGSKPINCGTATLLGKTFEIPLGTVLFDPMSPKYKDGNYSGLSEPAKPIEESDNQGKAPPSKAQ